MGTKDMQYSNIPIFFNFRKLSDNLKENKVDYQKYVITDLSEMVNSDSYMRQRLSGPRKMGFKTVAPGLTDLRLEEEMMTLASGEEEHSNDIFEGRLM